MRSSIIGSPFEFDRPFHVRPLRGRFGLCFVFLQICDPFRVVRFLISGVFYRRKLWPINSFELNEGPILSSIIDTPFEFDRPFHVRPLRGRVGGWFRFSTNVRPLQGRASSNFLSFLTWINVVNLLDCVVEEESVIEFNVLLILSTDEISSSTYQTVDSERGHAFYNFLCFF